MSIIKESGLLIGTSIIATRNAQDALDSITCGKAYVITGYRCDAPVIVGDCGQEQRLPKVLLTKFKLSNSVPKYTDAEINPISLKEQNLIMAVLALYRGEPLECDGKPVRAGRQINVDKTYARAYAPLLAPWGFIHGSINFISVDAKGLVSAYENHKEDAQYFPIILNLEGVKLPQTIERPVLPKKEIK